MHIKTVNTDSKYKCIVMRGNDPGRINRGKGYKAVNWLNCCETPRKSNFLINGKIVNLVKIRNFSRSQMTKRISPLESSREI